MTALRLLLAALVFSVCVNQPALAGPDPADKYPDLHLIPWPKSLQRTSGDLLITADSRIVADDDRLKPLAEVLASEIAKLTGVMLQVKTGGGKPGDIVLKINPTLKADESILMLRNRRARADHRQRRAHDRNYGPGGR